MIPLHERRILEAFILKIPMSQLEISRKEMDEYQKNDLKNLIKLRMKGIPLQYLIGEQAFYGRDFYVNTHVLIPRPETEGLVETLLLQLPKKGSAYDLGKLQGLELGTGSGCIPITLVIERSDIFITSTDCSVEALEVAKENQRRLRVKNIHFLQVNSLPQLKDYEAVEPCDFIVSNPPYLDRTDEISEEVLEHEPSEALFTHNEDPLHYYKFLCDLIHFKLKPDGVAVFEIASNRSEETKAIFTDSGLSAEIKKDLADKDRYLIVRFT